MFGTNYYFLSSSSSTDTMIPVRRAPVLALPALVLLLVWNETLILLDARVPPLPKSHVISLRGGQHDCSKEGYSFHPRSGPSVYHLEEEGEIPQTHPTTIPSSAATCSPLEVRPAGAIVPTIAVGGAKPWIPLRAQDVPQKEPSTKGASIPNEIFNLVKSIVGAGVLGLPAGVAAFGGTEVALIPAISIMAVAGILSAYCFSLIGRTCSYTGAVSYRQAWERTVGPRSAWIPAAACFMVTSCSVLAYSMILSVTLPSLASAFLGIEITRPQALLGVTTFALLPLCLLKSLKALGPFSLVGIMGMFYTCIAMGIRWWDGSYGVTGNFVDDLPFDLSPRFGPPEDIADLLTPDIFVLVSLLSTAFMAHYNAPKFFLELHNNTLFRYNTVVAVSFFVSFLLFVAVASFGFATFGKSCAGLVLNNYANDDQLMRLSRIAVTLSLLFSYPLAFVGVREGLLDLLKVEKRSDSLQNGVTVLLLSLITWLAYTLTDLRQLLAFNGATWGNAVIYLLPTYMFIQCARKIRPELRKEVPIVALTGLIGLFMGILGTGIALNS